MRFSALTLLIPSGLLSALAAGLIWSPQRSSPDSSGSLPPLRERRSFCFAPGTDPATIANYDAPAKATKVGASFLTNTTLAKALQISDRWGTTATNGNTQSSQGDPVTLTWSIVPDETFINSGGIEGEVSSGSDLRARLVEIYGGTATGPAADQPWFAIFEAAFESLSSQTGLTFVYEPNDDGTTLSTNARGILGTRGDMRIAGHELDGNSSVLAYNYFPDYGDMVIDTADNYYDSTFNSSIRLRNVLEHEFGHGLGLDHVCPANGTKLMEPTINLSFRGAQFDTIYSLQRNYGDPFEKLNSALDNDSLNNASPIPVTTGVPWTSDYLGIDDNSDTDYLSFQAAAGTLISATITPTTNAYLEGAQLADGECAAGTTFDSSSQQDLTLVLLNENGTALATANSEGLGEAEILTAIPTTSSGTHYLRITGSGANSNQLYTAEVSLEIPGVSFEVLSTVITQELFTEQNGEPDPLETIEVAVVLRNIGELDAESVEASLSASAALIPIVDSAVLGNITSGEDATFTLVFALDGNCGDTINLPLELTTDNSDPVTHTLTFTLGGTGIVFEENFDSSGQLPIGWSNETDGGSGWSINTTSSSAPNSLFAANLDSTGESILVSPSVGPVLADSILSFTHSYNTEGPWDGGVLEISIAGGDWEDVLDAGGTFTSGGYNGTLRRRTTNPLSNRPAWEGDSDGFLTTTLTLPNDSSGQMVQFRWRLGHDNTASEEGWYLDNIALSSILCDTSGPIFLLSSEDLVTSEFSPENTAALTIETPLPVAVETTVTLTPSGTADANSDLTGLEDLTLSALSSQTNLLLSALSDSLAEGPEDLILTTSDGLQSLTFTILDTPYGSWSFQNISDELLRGASDDADGDRSLNAEEYLFNTNPELASSHPQLNCAFVDGTLRLSIPSGSLPEDLLVDAESSSNLEDWNPTFMRFEDDQFILTPPSSPYFLRLTYDLLQTTPLDSSP